MIKEILEQLAPLDAQIAALKGNGNDMDALTAHASELAELAVEEDEILRTCGPLTAEDRVFLARHFLDHSCFPPAWSCKTWISVSRSWLRGTT